MSQKNREHNLMQAISKIKAGDEQLRNDFIEKYKAFTVSVISKTTNRYVDVNNSEELSIGLIAFNEAIDKYEEEKGAFLSFAQIVIRSRIYDHFKKEKRNQEMILDDYSQIESVVYEDDHIGLEFKEEINVFKAELKKYGLTFKDLITKSPKHSRTKENAAVIGEKIFSNPILLSEFERKKKIPIRSAAKYCNVSEKVIKTSKVYITAYILILKIGGNLKSYLSKKGGVMNDA